MDVFLLGVTGGSGSGKTTLARALVKKLGASCAVIAQDSYYIDQSARFDGDGGSVNFDHPDSLDFALLAAHLKQLRAGIPVDVPVYDFATHTRRPYSSRLAPAPVVVVDGTLLLSQPAVVSALDACVFVDASEEERYRCRLRRDVEERGRTPEGVERQFRLQVKPMHDLFIEPNKDRAKLIVDGRAPLSEALESLLRLLPRPGL
jgi:uridine kinase